MVIYDAPTLQGIVLTCRIIGILQIEQKSKGEAERNDRLFAVPGAPTRSRAVARFGAFRSKFSKSLRSSSSRPMSLRTKGLRGIEWVILRLDA